MDNLFLFSFTLKLPVYTITLVLSTTWEGFGKGRASNEHWKDFSLGFMTVSFVHRTKYDEAINAELVKIFGDGSNGIRVVRLDRGKVTEDEAVPSSEIVDKDMLN